MVSEVEMDLLVRRAREEKRVMKDSKGYREMIWLVSFIVEVVAIAIALTYT